MRQQCRITCNNPLNSEYVIIGFHSTEIAAASRPGCFYHLAVPRSETSLRVPISCYDVIGNEIFLLVKIIGEGTRCLAQLQKEDTLDVMGPLGNSFTHVEGKRVLLVSGGVGYAPLRFLKRVLEENNEIRWVHGGRAEEDAMPADLICTED
ncbi:MAG: hypothetical protein K8S56_03665 [Candidatus Cloacimonetes bacterium]|nr:hypothetical protein [Candidatus Cloacimonadota bacterium]